MSLLFIFIDGIGVGPNQHENPLADPGWTSFSYFTGSNGLHSECKTVYTDDILYKPIDANLGIEGLPQSGTGQVTLFSGVNASKLIGKHFGPYPYTKTRYLLKEKSLFHKIKQLDKSPHFLNAYPDIFFERSEKRNRWTSTTLMARSSGVELNRTEDVINERAVTAEIKQDVWRKSLQIDVPEITPEEAGARVLKSLENNDLVLYEYYLTDKAGHSMSRKRADEVRDVLNPFLMKIINDLDPKDTLLITSDHGNLEDLSTKSHTRNPVPLFVKGDVEHFKKAGSIIDITPSIISLLKKS